VSGEHQALPELQLRSGHTPERYRSESTDVA